MKYKTLPYNNRKKYNEITRYFNLSNYTDEIKPRLLNHIQNIKLEKVHLLTDKTGKQYLTFDWKDQDTTWSDGLAVEELLKLYFKII